MSVRPSLSVVPSDMDLLRRGSPVLVGCALPFATGEDGREGRGVRLSFTCRNFIPISVSNDTCQGVSDLLQGEGVDRCINASFADQKIVIDYWHMILGQLNVYFC